MRETTEEEWEAFWLSKPGCSPSRTCYGSPGGACVAAQDVNPYIVYVAKGELVLPTGYRLLPTQAAFFDSGERGNFELLGSDGGIFFGVDGPEVSADDLVEGLAAPA